VPSTKVEDVAAASAWRPPSSPAAARGSPCGRRRRRRHRPSVPTPRRADDLLWRALHDGQYDKAPPALQAAYLVNPRDVVTAAHIGWVRIWRLRAALAGRSAGPLGLPRRNCVRSATLLKKSPTFGSNCCQFEATADSV
jgi:hypothetical protein